MPTAADGTIGYGLPATVAVGGAPALVSVTEVTVSPFTSPVVVNSVPAKVKVVPYGLVWLLAVIVSGAGGDGQRAVDVA